MTLLDRIRTLTAAHFHAAIDQVTDATRYADHLGADALDMIELAFEVEEAFGIEFDDDAIGDIITVADMVIAVQQLLRRKEAA